jgi:hypothetical protein
MMPSESLIGWHFMNHAKTLMGIPSSQFIFGLVSISVRGAAKWRLMERGGAH